MKDQFKPLFEQLKTTLKNKDQIREIVMISLKETRNEIESKAKEYMDREKGKKLFIETLDKVKSGTLVEEAYENMKHNQWLQKSFQPLRQNPVLLEKVIPALESDRAEMILRTLHSKLGTHLVLRGVERVRQDLIDLKVSKAKGATPTTEKAAEKNEATKLEVTEGGSADTTPRDSSAATKKIKKMKLVKDD